MRRRVVRYGACNTLGPMVRRALGIAGLALVLFHGWLFAGQAWDGQLLELPVVVRWLIAGGLAWGLYTLRRQGAPLFSGRKAATIWLVAALLHGPAVAERIESPGAPALPEVVAVLTQVSVGAVAAFGLLLLAALLGRARRPELAIVSAARSDRAPLGPLAAGTYFLFAPRPPPVA